MKFKFLFLLYAIGYSLLAIFSYGFVDPNFPLKPPASLANLVYFHRPLATAMFLFLTGGLCVLYAAALRAKFSARQVRQLILAGVIILLFSFPAFSYDIFNYLATAKVTFFYRENPYLVMPVELTGDPLLAFMHAANKFALYGPVWILLTAVPHFLGLGHLLLTVFTFKAFVALFYLGAGWLIWRLSGRSIWALVFFALNPLVVMETLVSGHNDVVMMVGVLAAFYLIARNHRLPALFFWLASVGIKYATIVLAPAFLFYRWLGAEKAIRLAAWLMLVVFLLSPLREEIYPWYFIWVVALAALAPKDRLLRWLVLGFTVGLLWRNVPWLYFRSWSPPTPLLKTLFTFLPPSIGLGFYFLKKFRRS